MEKNSKIKVSVCISVHNTAHLLPRCLDSIVRQDMDGIEVVLVNNGSTDRSETIMRQFSFKYSSIQWRIITQEDRGLAQGRQIGINNASGEYITFLDADDFVQHSAYRKMYDIAKQYDTDIVECQTVREGKIISSPYVGLKDSKRILRDYFMTNNLPSMLWMRLYHRKLFAKPVLPKIYINNEDMFALPCLLFAANSIYFLNEPLHEYTTDNEASVMKVLTENPACQGKYYQNRLKTLNCIQFVASFIGEDINKIAREYNSYKAYSIVGFIFAYFPRVSLSHKFDDICENLGFESRKEVLDFIKRSLNPSLRIAKRMKSIGFYPTYFLYWLYQKISSK